MATIQQRSTGSFRVQIRRRGLKTLSKTFKSKKAAIEWSRKTESELERGVYLDTDTAQQTLFSALITRYLDEVAVNHKGFIKEKSRGKGVSVRLRGLTLAEITPAILSKYRDDRLSQVKPKTVKEELGLVQRVINTCIKDWGINIPHSTNPVSLIRKPKVSDARERRLSVDEYEVISQIPVFCFAIETGMRRGEIAGMQWQHVDLDARVVTLPDTKNGKVRQVPLTDKAFDILRNEQDAVVRRISGGVWEWTADLMTHKFIKLAKQHNFEDLRLHDLRHEATSRFFELGLNPMEVASITGHQDLRMLRRYSHISPEHLLKKLSYREQ